MSDRYKQLEDPLDLEKVLSKLKGEFPANKHMHQIVSDILDQSLQANLYVDQWPDFTTVISQEFRPRLSDHSDLRIYTTDKEKIMPLLTNAGLLENTGRWQLIHYILSTKDCEEVSSYLLDSLKRHPNTKHKTSALIFDYGVHNILDIMDFIPLAHLPPEYFIKKVPLERAEYVAKHWIPAEVEYPLSIRTKFTEDLISHFALLGVYHHSNHDYPIAWVGLEPGGIEGMAYVVKEHRGHSLMAILAREMTKVYAPKGILSQTKYTIEAIPLCRSHIISIY